jgi:membrane-associated phospholipid phosphatase
LALGALGGKLAGSKVVSGVSWRALKSTLLAGAAVMVLKSAIGRQRPYQSPDDPYVFYPFTFSDSSMPSGHTAVAFSLAASLAAETRDKWSDAVFFGLATLTAFGRMHYDKHWASDTVVGAGIGILSARLINRPHQSLIVAPGTVAMSLSF